MSIIGLSQEVADQVHLAITGQTIKDILAQQEGVQKPRHHLLERLPQAVLLQNSGEHRCIKPPCIVGCQHHGVAEGTKEGDEGGEKIMNRDGVHQIPVAEQSASYDREACDLSGTVSEGMAGEGVGIKDPLSTDGRQLDDVTHISV